MAKFLLPDNLNPMISAEALVVAHQALGPLAEEILQSHRLRQLNDQASLRTYLEICHDIANHPDYSPELIPNTWVSAESLVVARDVLGRPALDMLRGFGLEHIKADERCLLHNLIGIFFGIAITIDLAYV